MRILPLILSSFCILTWTGHASAADDAYEQNKRLGRGVNVLGWDPLWHDRSKARFKAEHFRRIHEVGFNSVRVVLNPFRDTHPDASGKIDESWFQTVDWILDQALANHLVVDLDFHEYQTMSKDPQANHDRFISMWTRIAEHCKDRPRDVMFELLNEPHDKLTADLWNQYLADALAAVRKSNPDRTIIIGPTQWNSIGQLKNLRLPEADRNLIVTVHYYSPMAFTHQGASWTNQKDKVGVQWKGTPEERQAVAHDFDQAQAWAEQHRRPILLGEFGAYDKGDMDSRVRWTDCVAREAEKRGWSWAYWQFDGDFIVYDIRGDHWVEPILHALIPKKE